MSASDVRAFANARHVEDVMIFMAARELAESNATTATERIVLNEPHPDEQYTSATNRTIGGLHGPYKDLFSTGLFMFGALRRRPKGIYKFEDLYAVTPFRIGGYGYVSVTGYVDFLPSWLPLENSSAAQLFVRHMLTASLIITPTKSVLQLKVVDTPYTIVAEAKGGLFEELMDELIQVHSNNYTRMGG